MTFCRLGWRRQALFVEALALVAFAWAVTRLLPYRWVSPLYGRPRAAEAAAGESAGAPGRRPFAPDPAVRDVRWALRMVHRRLAWDRSCLARALAGRIMLRRRGYSTTLYIGAFRGTASAPGLHAWLLEHGAPVTGVGEIPGLATLAVFDGD